MRRASRSALFPYTTLFRSVRLYEKLALELDYNVMFSQQGHLTIAHTDRGVTTLRERAEVNRLLGVDRSEEHTSELQSHSELVCRLLLEKKNKTTENRRTEI